MKLYNEIKRNSGGTFSPQGYKADMKKGYMVSHEDYETVLPMKNKKAVTKQLKKYKRLAKELNGFVGAWVNGAEVFLDISFHLTRKTEAIKLGKENNQLAIYSLTTEEVINL